MANRDHSDEMKQIAEKMAERFDEHLHTNPEEIYEEWHTVWQLAKENEDFPPDFLNWLKQQKNIIANQIRKNEQGIL